MCCYRTDPFHFIFLLPVSGYISNDVHINHLKDQQKKYGVGNLNEIYTEPIKGYQVDKVIFVQGGNTRVPKNLLQCIQSVIRERNPDTGIPICKFVYRVADTLSAHVLLCTVFVCLFYCG